MEFKPPTETAKTASVELRSIAETAIRLAEINEQKAALARERAQELLHMDMGSARAFGLRDELEKFCDFNEVYVPSPEVAEQRQRSDEAAKQAIFQLVDHPGLTKDGSYTVSRFDFDSGDSMSADREDREYIWRLTKSGDTYELRPSVRRMGYSTQSGQYDTTSQDTAYYFNKDFEHVITEAPRTPAVVTQHSSSEVTNYRTSDWRWLLQELSGFAQAFETDFRVATCEALLEANVPNAQWKPGRWPNEEFKEMVISGIGQATWRLRLNRNTQAHRYDRITISQEHANSKLWASLEPKTGSYNGPYVSGAPQDYYEQLFASYLATIQGLLGKVTVK